MLAASGINALHKRSTSGVQARLSADVPCAANGMGANTSEANKIASERLIGDFVWWEFICNSPSFQADSDEEKAGGRYAADLVS
jgi:hypothetical protein